MLDDTELTFSSGAAHRRRSQVAQHVREAVAALRNARRSLLASAAVPGKNDAAGPDQHVAAVDDSTRRLIAHWAQTVGAIGDRLDEAVAASDGRHDTAQQPGEVQT